jgi:putative ABC transport system ATP-binding protein
VIDPATGTAKRRPAPGGNPALVVDDVHKEYRRGPETVRALQGISLVLHQGELAVLLGRSGSGKTTLLNCIAGWETPDRGSITTAAAPAAVTPWQSIAVVPQRFGLLPELTLAENITLPLRLAGLTDTTRDATDVLLAFEIDHLADRRPEEVSLGEQQRAALARAAVMRPRLLIADEPTGRLDEDLSVRVLQALHQLCESHGTASLIASHDPVAEQYADTVFRLQDGILKASAVTGIPLGGSQDPAVRASLKRSASIEPLQ